MGRTSAAGLFFSIILLAFNSNATEINDTDNSQKIIKSHAIAMHGAPKYKAGFSHFDYSNPNAPKGGKVRRSSIGTFDSFNPFIAKGNVETNIGSIYDTLMTQSGDEAFSVYGLVAESAQYPEDRSWVIFNINPNARFHDGESINADDIVFSFNTLMEKGAPQFKQYFADVKEVIELSPKRVKFTFKQTENRELILIVSSLAVLPKHFWQDKSFDKSSLSKPLGSGPYQLGEFDAGRHVSYTRVKDYWARDLPVNKGRYNFDHIRFDYYRDRNIELEAFKAGEYDLRIEYTSKSWATEYSGSKFDSGEIIKEMLRDSSPQGRQAFILNMRRKPFDDINFRRAMVLAFDFEWSNSNLFYGAYNRSPSYFTNSELAATGLPEGRELEILNAFKDQLPEQVFTKENTPPTTDGTGRDRRNLIKAQALLKKAGYKIVRGKLQAPNGNHDIELEFITYSPQFERIINPYIKNLKKLGITAELRIIDTSQYINRLREFDFDITTYGRGQTDSPGNEQRNMWGSEAADTKMSANYSGIKNPVVDALIELIIAAPNREELVFRTRALDRVLLHYDYVVPQWYNAFHRIAYWNKFDRPETLVPFDRSFDLNFSTWWLRDQ